MSMAATQTASGTTEWLDRLRFLALAAIVWAGLHFVVGGFLLPRGLDRPVVLAAAPYAGFLPGLLVIGMLWGGAAVAALVVGRAGQRAVLMALGLALAVWAAEGWRLAGTMETWLIFSNPRQGPPASAPYWRLLIDYLYLALGLAGAYRISRRLDRSNAQPTASSDTAPAKREMSGPAALLVATVVTGIVVFFLAGPNLAEVRRGQVYFAVLVGTLLGTMAADRLTKVHEPLWYCLSPLAVGIIGLLVAAIRPGLMLPSEYQHVNSIPAWGLVRALPVEMMGVGLVGALWLLPSVRPKALSEEGS